MPFGIPSSSESETTRRRTSAATIVSDLLKGARYIKLGALEAIVEGTRQVLRRARLEMWETKKELGILPPPAQMADEIVTETAEALDDSPPESFFQN